MSLSAPGKAADAAAVGAALAGKAPAQEDESFPGCYYRMVNGIKEWINPPMILGVEYRTTERWNGKPIYVKAVNIGAVVNGVNTKYTEARYNGAVKVSASAGGYLAPYYLNGVLAFSVSAEPTDGGVHVSLYSNGTFDGIATTVCLWYTKD